MNDDLQSLMQMADVEAKRYCRRMHYTIDVEELRSQAYLGIVIASKSYRPKPEAPHETLRLWTRINIRFSIGKYLSTIHEWKEGTAREYTVKKRQYKGRVSLSQKCGDDLTLEAILGRDDPEFLGVEKRDLFNWVMGHARFLEPVDKQIFHSYYADNQSFDTIGQALAMTKQGVEQRHSRALSKVKREVRKCMDASADLAAAVL